MAQFDAAALTFCLGLLSTWGRSWSTKTPIAVARRKASPSLSCAAGAQVQGHPRVQGHPHVPPAAGAHAV